MVARLSPFQAPLKLTQENHPENFVETEKPPTFSLLSMVALGALCGMVGMILGTAALSTAMLAESVWEVVCLIPLVVALVCFLSGWVASFFWMCREEASKHES